MSDERPPRLTHLDDEGRIAMVDVSDKPATRRLARAQAIVHMAAATARALAGSGGAALPKGDALAAARIAGVMAAKRTSELVPLCHGLPLDHVDVTIALDEGLADGSGAKAVITATAVTTARTGVEMEALTAVTVAALTIYDMAKAIDRGMIIGEVMLLEKEGGRSGRWVRGA